MTPTGSAGPHAPAGGAPNPMEVEFAGHSTLLIDLDGVRVVTDPLIRPRLLHLRRHAPAVDLRRYLGARVLLISHSHLDHLDRASLKFLSREIAAVVPNDSVKLLRRFGFRDVQGVSAGDVVEAGGLRVEAVFADHGGKRLPWNAPAETLGYVVRGSQSFYFAGDTDLFEGMRDLTDIDLALIPVWGWGSSIGIGHLDPVRGAEAVGLIRPRVAVPIHWGGYLPPPLAKTKPHLLTDPPREFCRLVAERGADTRALLIEPGDRASVAPA